METCLDIKFLDVDESDVDELMYLHNQNYLLDKWDRSKFVQLIENQIPTIKLCVGDDLVGFVTYLFCLDEIRVLNIVIAKNYRSLGYGKRLFEEMLKHAKYEKVRYILLDVRVSNKRAIHFYKQYGFEILHRRANFYNNDEVFEDAYFMQLELDKQGVLVCY